MTQGAETYYLIDGGILNPPCSGKGFRYEGAGGTAFVGVDTLGSTNVRTTEDACGWQVGQDSSRYWLFQQAYDRWGGRDTLGCATGPASWWNGGGGWVVRQDFDGTCCGAVIIHDEGRDDPIGSLPAYAVGGVLGLDYRNYYGYLGPPVSDLYVNYYWPGPSYVQVDFLNGYLWYNGASRVQSYATDPWILLQSSTDTTLNASFSETEGRGLQLILDGLGGPAVWRSDLWTVRHAYETFYPPTPRPLYLTWEQFDKAHSLHLAFWIEGTDMVKRVLVYSANAPNWWGAQGWVDMGISPGYNQWANFARDLRADYKAEYGNDKEPRAVRDIRVGHFVYSGLGGEGWV